MQTDTPIQTRGRHAASSLRLSSLLPSLCVSQAKHMINDSPVHRQGLYAKYSSKFIQRSIRPFHFCLSISATPPPLLQNRTFLVYRSTLALFHLIKYNLCLPFRFRHWKQQKTNRQCILWKIINCLKKRLRLLVSRTRASRLPPVPFLEKRVITD